MKKEIMCEYAECMLNDHGVCKCASNNSGKCDCNAVVTEPPEEE